MAQRTTTQADRDARYGNERIAKAAFIQERMRQTGCLAIEAAREWDADDEPYMGHDGSAPQPETRARAKAREQGAG
jgi:hypothetical protein